MTVSDLFICFAVASAAVHIGVDRRQLYSLSYAFKPLTMLLIIGSVVLRADAMSFGPTRWILAGLVFSLLGDIFLMLRKRQFTAGLAAFLVAHICYAVAFSKGTNATPAAAWIVAIAYGTLMFAALRPSIGHLAVPVAIYIGALLVMTVLAYSLWHQSGTSLTACAFSGALLFTVSDTVLGFRQFRKMFSNGQIIILVSYYAAQILISMSVPFSSQPL